MSINLGYVNVSYNLYRSYVFHNLKNEMQLGEKYEPRNSTFQALVSKSIKQADLSRYALTF